jgi:hypothetical protein
VDKITISGDCACNTLAKHILLLYFYKIWTIS